MTDETLDQAVEAEPVAETEVETPEIEVELDDNGEPIEANADDLDDYEHNGKTYRVPKDLKEGVLRQADYTRKTQEVAEQRKALEARVSLVEQQAAFVEEHRTEVAKLGALDHEIQQWDKWIRDNPNDATTADMVKLTTLQRDRDQQARDLGHKLQTRTVEGQRADAKALDDMRAELPKIIPGFTPETERQIGAFATTSDLGFSPEEIAGIRDPRHVKLLHLAMLGAKQARQTTAAKTVLKQQDTAPAPEVGGKRAPATGLSDSLPGEEWNRRRNEQLRKRAGR